MKTRRIFAVVALMLLALPLSLRSQTDWGSVFNTLKLEARADFQITHNDESATIPEWNYGFRGKYFDLKMGGNLGSGFSYFLRQNIRANDGTIAFFDNTDFLWLNYNINDHWRLRFGKDAMAVGGYEYDAAPLDEYHVAEYWNNFYCFQMAFSAAYTWDGGRQSVVAQISQSPYVNSLNLNWDAGLLAYNVEWLGSIGEHLHTLWSVNMLERKRGKFMNLIFLGTQLTFEHWDVYLDIMHHALSTDDWAKNYGFVARFNYHFTPDWAMFVKASYEQNHSEVDSPVLGLDNLVPSGMECEKIGVGAEYRPHGMTGVRLHAYLGYSNGLFAPSSTGLDLNVGATWTMDFHKLFNK